MAQTVTLTNSGTSALTISSIATSGDFAQTNTCPVSPATLAAGADCAISVTFTPTTTETRRGSVTLLMTPPVVPTACRWRGSGWQRA